MRHFFILLLFLCSQNSLAADFGGYVTMTTDYVKRGVTQSDDKPALQLGAEIDFDSGWYFGAWGSTVDIANGFTRKRDVEINYYAGYVFDISRSWQISAGAVAYVYPGQSGDVNYDYEEYSLGGSFDDRVWLEFTYSPDLYHSGLSSTNLDLYAEWPFGDIWAIGAGAGRYDASKLTGNAYEYWQLGITASLSRADIDFRFHNTDRWIPIISSRDRANSRFVLAIRIPF